MFDKVKALLIYKQMKLDLMENRSNFKKWDIYDGIDRGFVAVNIKKSSPKIEKQLDLYAQKDNYSFKSVEVQNNITGELQVLFSIDNEDKEAKRKRMEEIIKYAMSLDKENDHEIINLEEYRLNRKK